MKTSDEVRSFTVASDDDGIRVDRWFKRHLPQVGFGTVSKWTRTGQVRVDGKRVKPDDRLEQGQQIRVPPGGDAPHRKAKPKRELSKAEIEQAEAMVIKQTKGALVLNKPPGLATQGGTNTFNHVDGLLDAFAPGEEDVRPRLVHRLDKDTSGVLLVARTPGSAAFFSKRFSGRSAKKIYWALVIGVPDIKEGVIEAPLAKQPGSGGEKMHVDHEGGQPAKTKYRVVDSAGKKAAWLELQPLTGRTHQLRVHCAAMGHPIVGDGKYGGKDAFLTGTISRKMHLHARRLIIDSPDGGKLDVTADLPEHFAGSMEQLGFEETLSDAMPMRDDPPPKTREEKKQQARQHAKNFRKSQRSPRRARGGAGGKSKPKGRRK
ncbi:RluA family pseudouridine synthase [Erythrobacter sp.]|uniref:RluA family pseudouridine synthase n=1 Tax=Erythrobacter sp. TaxID=1042 RepID=UPI001B22C50D|nr:RluA family pseudouridine synthase [Erythrobacter sp.]MBO6525702.1 RluA family pseudouridine synthase [Erythrobacter sp.]MBO6529624.1 RluA family pseudouridine synthase [Erythrobacter sp.]